MSAKDTFSYPGKNATVLWNGRLCIHIGECGRAKGELFVAGRKPWCQPDLVDDDEVREVVLRCPTGALSYLYADGSNAEEAPEINTIQVAYNGPLFVNADLHIDAAPGDAPGLKFRAALCRCGKSKNKPFCDNSHEAEGFQDYGAVGDSGPGLEESGGPLQISLAQDGPLLVKGNVTIKGGSGRSSWQGKQVALCRCGQSNNKPFCDGQHKNAGFKST
jgi:CDGSH-type Zn-finger protein/uncharacterized Fe-S cluster protein YjdI